MPSLNRRLPSSNSLTSTWFCAIQIAHSPGDLRVVCIAFGRGKWRISSYLLKSLYELIHTLMYLNTSRPARRGITAEVTMQLGTKAPRPPLVDEELSSCFKELPVPRRPILRAGPGQELAD